MVLWVRVGLKMSVCAFVYFAHDFDRVVFVFVKITCVCLCLFVRLRLWEGGCQVGLFWGHSDARVRHIQTLPGPPYHNSSHHKSQRRKSAPQTNHTTLPALPHHNSRSDLKPKTTTFKGRETAHCRSHDKSALCNSLFCPGNDPMLQLQ